MPRAVDFPPRRPLVALRADEVAGLLLEQAVQGVLDGPPDSSRRSVFRLSSFSVTMGSGMALLQYASCLDNSNHTGAGRPPFLSGRYPAVKVRKKLYVTVPRPRNAATR